jgi:hypothetical protein
MPHDDKHQLEEGLIALLKEFEKVELFELVGNLLLIGRTCVFARPLIRQHLA